ncbi:MAG: ABC transporter ATP-binding protein [Clostridia bacterium]|nr:ABC transporter ATP-binding protein [Clostridia bacterium]NCC44371.1 ABC transporter ATP-binding protein [Clostridia bacterium]
MSNNTVEIQNLKVNLMSPRGVVHAVRNINLNIGKGEIHGLVGESGCGKSMTAKSILRLHDERKMLYNGKILYNDNDILQMKPKEIQAIRGDAISMIFQDPMTSLNPLFTVGQQLTEVFTAHSKEKKRDYKKEVYQLLEDVGIYPAEKRYDQYPFEMSGGMLQRVMIAMAVACQPELLIADEPTTALDVTVQEQILQLFLDLREKRNMSILIITHNFGVVAEICDTVSVMYAGTIVESGSVHEVFDNAKHPYTKDLIRSIPKSGQRGGKLVTIPGTPPDLREKIIGCPYAPRCQYADDSCRNNKPSLESVSDTHRFACHKGNEI